MKGDSLGQFTCHTYNGASVVDYVAVSQNLFSNIPYFCVSDTSILSHHCSLSFSLKATVSKVSEVSFELSSHPEVILWNDDSKDIFTESTGSDSVRRDLNELFDSLDGAKFDIDDVVNKFTNVLSNVSKKVMPVKKGKSSKGRMKHVTIQRQKLV